MKTKHYAPFFCEENIWQLANNMNTEAINNSHILFITNKYKTCALMNQRAAEEGNYIIWDYHVVLHNKSTNSIIDFDTRLETDTSIEEYFNFTFGCQTELPPAYRSSIIPIKGEEYLHKFSSDRSHMLDEHGHQAQNFPKWPIIQNCTELTLSNLMSLNKVITDRYKLYPVEGYLEKYT